MARVATDDAGPTAFEVQLSISTGRNSPDCDPVTIKVNAGSTIRMVFMNGAYILREKHSRDVDTLLKDFDLYLVRTGRDDIVLNPSREIADYGIKKNEPMDQLQFRHKTIPIPIVINLCEGDDRKIEVNSGFPLMDVIPTICDMFGIKEHAELSLARPSSDDHVQYDWLSLTSSLHGQDIQTGDTLLLRKKFFIVNDDIQEALKGNQELMELIYQQIRVQYLTGKFVGGYHGDEGICALVSALIHHIEQGGESISDDKATCKVMPQDRQKDASFYAQIVTTYYREHVSSLDKSGGKTKLLQLFSEKQTILINYYPVKLSEDSADHVIAIGSDSVALCQPDDSGQLQAISSKTWRIRDLRDADISSQKEDSIRVNVLGSWQSLFSSHRQSLSNYLLEAVHLTKMKAARQSVSARITSPEVNEVYKRNSQLWVSAESKIESSVDEPTNQSTDEIVPVVIPVNGTSVDATKEERRLSFEWPVTEGAEVRESEGVESKPEESAGEEQEEQLQSNDITVALDTLSDASGSLGAAAIHPVSNLPQTDIEFNAPYTSPPKEQKKKDLSAHTTVHIPDFLELDYRQILDDYKLFHIVVMKQDVRPVLLHTGKPIQEVVRDICGTFSINDPDDYYLWIPTGIQSIIEKYGGKPKVRAGRFRKRSSVIGDFAPRLDNGKNLKEQYDFSIKPFLLHLRMYQHEEGVDAPDESSIDCGEEWPDCEHPDVARYRRFYQSWTGLVQGAYPVEKKAAVRLAAMLTQVYYGDRERTKDWPPQDYDAKSFLPEKLHHSFGIVGEVERAHRELTGSSTHECINDVIEACQKLNTHQGVFFDVSVPVKSEIMAVIPWKKMEHRWFGINQHGIFSVEQDSGKILFTHRFSDIYKWTSNENSFQLDFKEWAEEFHGYTYQTREILNTLELFIQMTIRGRINQAPSKPPSIGSGADIGSTLDTPPTTPLKSPLNDSGSEPLKRSSISTPTSYDL